MYSYILVVSLIYSEMFKNCSQTCGLTSWEIKASSFNQHKNVFILYIFIYSFYMTSLALVSACLLELYFLTFGQPWYNFHIRKKSHTTQPTKKVPKCHILNCYRLQNDNLVSQSVDSHSVWNLGLFRWTQSWYSARNWRNSHTKLFLNNSQSLSVFRSYCNHVWKTQFTQKCCRKEEQCRNSSVCQKGELLGNGQPKTVRG